MRIVFLGTPEFAFPSLNGLYREGYEIAGVVTQPDRPRGRAKTPQPSPVKEKALRLGLPLVQPHSLKDPGFLQWLEEKRPELMVVVAYGKILPPEVLRLPLKGCINLHPSLLPKYRGAAPIQRALMAGEKETGVTTFWMEERLDAGDIILQERADIPEDITAGELQERLALLGADLLLKTLELVREGRAPRIPQEENRATYAPPLTPEDERIDWHRSAWEIHNQIRALSPQPGAYAIRQGRRLKIFKSQLWEEGKRGCPGEVLKETPEGFVVQAGSGQLLILEVQPEGKKRMRAKDYTRGHPFKEGERLL